MIMRFGILVGVAALLFVSVAPARGQFLQGQNSPQGTQFVGRPQPPPPAPAPAPVPAPAPPAPAAAPAPTPPPPPPVVQAPPPRFPTVVFLLDTSDSMLDHTPGKEVSHLDEAKAAIAEVIRGMDAQTQVQVWSFNTRLVAVPVGGQTPGTFISAGDTNLRDELIAKTEALRTGGGTNLYEAIVKTLKLFAKPEDQALYRSGERFPVLVIVSDGVDSGVTRTKMPDVLAAKEANPLVTINTIGFTGASDVDNPQEWLKSLCQIATSAKGCGTADDQAKLGTILKSFYQPAIAQR